MFLVPRSGFLFSVRVLGSGFGVQGSVFRVWCSGFAPGTSNSQPRTWNWNC